MYKFIEVVCVLLDNCIQFDLIFSKMYKINKLQNTICILTCALTTNNRRQKPKKFYFFEYGFLLKIKVLSDFFFLIKIEGFKKEECMSSNTM